MALLDLTYDALCGASSATGRKMFFKAHVLYIDEGRAVYDPVSFQFCQHDKQAL